MCTPSSTPKYLCCRLLSCFKYTDRRDMSEHVLGQPPFGLKTAPSRVWIWTPSNTQFLGPTRVYTQIGSAIFGPTQVNILHSFLITSAILARLTVVTDRQITLLCLVTIGRIYLVIDWVMVLRPTRHKIGHFGDVLPSQSVGVVLKKLNLTQLKQTTQEQNSLSLTRKTHKMLNLNKCTNTKPKPTLILKNCSYVCVCCCAKLSYKTQHRTVLIIFTHPPDNHHSSDNVHWAEEEL